MNGRKAVAVDAGATNIRIGLVDEEGTILAKSSFSADKIRDAKNVSEYLAEQINELLDENRVSRTSCAGVGLAVPGPIDLETGVIEFAPNYPDWKNLPLRDQLSAWLGLPVLLDNDVNAQIIGEARYGAGVGESTFMLVSIGTGLGSGLIINNELWTGKHGVAPELGHITIDPAGPPCGCGRSGCLEAYASGAGITRRARELADLGATSLRYACNGDLDGLTPEVVAHAAGHHSAPAAEIFTEFGTALGLGLATAINFFDPGLILIGGKISDSWNLFFPAMRTALDERIFSEKAKRTRIEKAALIDEAGLLGAAATVFETASV